MRDSPFLPSTDESPVESLPILEDTDDRKVILLTPRGMPRLGLGCMVSLFIPAALLSLPFVLPNARVHEPWLLGGFLLLAIVVPIWVIWRFRTVLDSETTLILETNRITLRQRSFDQRTGELVGTDDKSVHLGPGSGMTDDESALHDDSNNLLTLTIWGPTDSLKVSAAPNEFPWLRQQIHDWLQRQVFANPDSGERQAHDPSLVISVANRQEHSAQNLTTVNESRTTQPKRCLELPQSSLIQVTDESREQLQIQIAAGGPAVASFGRNAIGQFFFMTAFGTLWYCVVPDMGGTPLVICAALWLVSAAVLGGWIRRLLESVHLQVTPERLMVTRKLLGWDRTQEIMLGSSPSVSLEVSEWHGSTPKPTLLVKGSDGEARFGKMLSDDEKRWLVMRLRAFLKLDLRTNIFAEPEGPLDS